MLIFTLNVLDSYAWLQLMCIYYIRMHAHKLHVIHEDVTQIPFNHKRLCILNSCTPERNWSYAQST